MTTHHSPITAPTSDEQAAFETVRADMVLGGRASMSGQYLAGLCAAAQVASVGAPEKLPRDLFPDFPDADPALIQAVWDRALVVGMHVERLRRDPDRYRERLELIRGELEAAGYAAMAGMVRRSLAMAVPVHPADGVSDGREH